MLLDNTGGSTPQDDPRNDSLLQDGAGGFHSILSDANISSPEDADPSHGSVDSGSSSVPFSLRETLRRWNGGHLLNTRSSFSPEYPDFSYDSLPSSSPNPSSVLSMCPPAYPGSSQIFILMLSFFFLCQTISSQMAEMKQLLMSSLSAMQTQIQTLRTDVNKAKKGKVCLNHIILSPICC